MSNWHLPRVSDIGDLIFACMLEEMHVTTFEEANAVETGPDRSWLTPTCGEVCIDLHPCPKASKKQYELHTYSSEFHQHAQSVVSTESH